MNAHQHVITNYMTAIRMLSMTAIIDDMAQIIICMDAHQRVITDCNQCECLAISVYVWQCRVLSMLCMLLHTMQILLFFPFFFFITQIILIVFLVLK